ncbi:hypothetical protein [Myceligenerans crystallogenes]|uniref:hypothetical protein n=1 Tax=Myceligenerans crystallogenes TaxID=316335 RepID=UPI0031DDED08
MRWSTGIVSRVLAAIVVVPTAAGCAASAPSDDGRSPFVVQPSIEPDGYMEALVGGEIAVQGGCFVLLSGEGKPSLVSWPFGTRRGKEGDDVVVGGGEVTVRPGDTVESGGGWVPLDDDAEYQEKCDLDGVGEVVQLNPDLRVVAGS